MKTILSTKGQVVIPSGVREQLSLKQNTELQVRIENDRIVLIPIRKDGWKGLRGILRGKRLTRGLETEHRKEIEKYK
ncbi:MAG: AbrB/MazE/SpoVT family DNA-binding domain-containing protein [Proteobacteria bacterium]|nr:AbrB/MazE/SpoVT family DNA-binding domain-containing protein [Pseudomonadota bacterium]